MTPKEVVDTLRKKFRKERYRCNKMAREFKSLSQDPELRAEVNTWLAAEKYLDELERLFGPPA
jgi:hypothetical protein